MRQSLRNGICLFLVIALVITSLSAVMGSMLPFERYGIARLDGSPLANHREITAWIDGVEYGDTLSFNGDGSYQIITDGDDESDATRKSGGINDDLIYYILDGQYLANEVDDFVSGDIVSGDLAFASAGQPSMDVKINELVPQPDDAGTQYVYLYEPTGAIDLTRWRLETHAGVIGTLNTLTTTAVGNLLYVDLGGSPLGTSAGHLMLSWQGAGGIAGNNWVTLDRVEYGDQGVKPDNTIHPEYPTAPGVGEGLIRVVPGQDTDDSSVDFTIDDETGRPSDDVIVTGIWVEKSGVDLIVHWDDVGMASYDVFYSTNQYADLGTWTLVGTVATNQFTHVGGLGGANFYYVKPTGAGMEFASSMAYCVDVEFTYHSAAQQRYYTSVPAGFPDMNADGSLTARDLVIHIEGHAGDGSNQYISSIGKWDATIGAFSDEFFYLEDPFDPGASGWTGGTDFAISPGDGIVFFVESTFTWQVNATDSEDGIGFTYHSAAQQRYYISVPYTIMDYNGDGVLTASDLVEAIEGHTGDGSNQYISSIGKWDATIGAFSDEFFYLEDPFDPGASGWTGGTDFAIAPGDGIVFFVESTFTWDPILIMPPQP